MDDDIVDDRQVIHVHIFPCYVIKKRREMVQSTATGQHLEVRAVTIPFIKNFMQQRKGKGDANSIMACEKTEEDSIRAYYNRFTSSTLNIPGHEEFLVTGVFAQGLLTDPLSKKMQGTVPQLRDEIKDRVDKYLR